VQAGNIPTTAPSSEFDTANLVHAAAAVPARRTRSLYEEALARR
jgi:hypothetical protein